jgi:hypothetical protein
VVVRFMRKQEARATQADELADQVGNIIRGL